MQERDRNKDKFKGRKPERRTENKDSSDMVYGLWPVVEAIKQGKEINKILIQKGLEGQAFAELRAHLKGSLVTLQMVPQQKLNKITRNNHQGVIAMISPVKYHSLATLLPTLLEEKEHPKLLVLDQVTDVRNFGAIARTAECTGYDAIVIPSKGSAMITPDAIRTSAGALFNIPVCKEENLRVALEFLSDHDVSIYSCSEKGEMPITEGDFDMPIAIIVGSEDNGISKDLINRSHYHCTIPMFGKTASLNVAVAAGMIMYETVRGK